MLKPVPGGIVFFSVILLSCLMGCGSTQAPDSVYAQTGGMNDSFTDAALGLDYEVPAAIPAIMVDQIGYDTIGKKTAIVKGTHLPEQFSVVDAETKEVVYTGTLTPGAGETAVMDFTALEAAGTYYLYADIVGSSWLFTVSDTVYDETFRASQKQFYLNRCGTSLTEQYAQEAAHSVCHTTPAVLQQDASKTLDVTGGWHLDAALNRDVEEGCRALDQMLLAYEMNPEAFSDETGIPESGNGVPDILDEAAYEVKWLLKMQDESTGGVYAAVLTDTPEGGNPMIANTVLTPITTGATASFSATLAHFSHLYRTYDEAFATQCVQASDKAFRLYRATSDAAAGAGFHAACELYRATHDERYAQVIAGYFKETDFSTALPGDDDYFYGALAYLATSGNVDTDACLTMMNVLMDEARAIARDASASPYGVAVSDGISDGAPDTGVAKVLRDMRTIAVANHILSNYEYRLVLQDHVHYLMGRNEAALNLVTNDSEYTYEDAGLSGARTKPMQAAQLIFLLSAITEAAG